MAPGSSVKRGLYSARRAHASQPPVGSTASGAFAAGSSPSPAQQQQQQQGTPFTLREGSPMDWSPFAAAVSTPLPDDGGVKESTFEAALRTPLPENRKQPESGTCRCLNFVDSSRVIKTPVLARSSVTFSIISVMPEGHAKRWTPPRCRASQGVLTYDFLFCMQDDWWLCRQAGLQAALWVQSGSGWHRDWCHQLACATLARAPCGALRAGACALQYSCKRGSTHAVCKLHCWHCLTISLGLCCTWRSCGSHFGPRSPSTPGLALESPQMLRIPQTGCTTTWQPAICLGEAATAIAQSQHHPTLAEAYQKTQKCICGIFPLRILSL